MYKDYMKFDDTLDVAIVHGCGMFSLKKYSFLLKDKLFLF
jgi:hypothetical protein